MDISSQKIGLVTLVDPMIRPPAGVIVQDDYDLHCPWHHHDMHQVQYAFEGSIELEDEHGRHFLPRSLAGWIPAGVTHRAGMRRVRSLSLFLAPDMVRNAGDRARVIRVSPLMREMLAEAVRWPISEPNDEIGADFFCAFGRLCGEWIAEEERFNLPTSTNPRLAAAINFTLAHLVDATLAEVCRVAGLSERTLRRQFQSELGMGWDDYRRRARLLSALEALADSRSSIAQIAAEVGFESQSSFGKAFQQLTGETPRDFRARVCRR